jgi:putative methyltransferase (TIGR04325 family)
VGIIEIGNRIAKNAWRLPVVGQVLALDYARTFKHRPSGRFRGVYATFADAEAAIPRGQPVGYDHAELASYYRNRMLKANQSDYAVLFWLRPLLRPDSVVFDFGGHVGVSYHGWRSYLSYPEGVRWIIADVPAITRVGEELARERPSAGLSFTNDRDDARGCSIYLALGSLQYVDEPLPSLLARCGTLPPHLIVNKVPLYDGATFVTVQSTGRAFHAYRIFNRQQFVSEITALGYRVVDDWTNREQHCVIPFTEGRDIDAYSGYYFTLAS